MKGLAILLCAVATLMPLAVSAETCVQPPAPQDPPNGATATRDEMRAAQEAIKAYNVAVTEFSACADRNGLDMAKANESVRRLEALANRFNAALRAYKERSGG